MRDDLRTLTVHILDKEYQVSCPDGKEEQLLRAARYLDEKMRETRSSGKCIGAERIAVMAALNITNDLLQANREYEQATRQSREHLSRLMEKVDAALEKANTALE